MDYACRTVCGIEYSIIYYYDMDRKRTDPCLEIARQQQEKALYGGQNQSTATKSSRKAL